MGRIQKNTLYDNMIIHLYKPLCTYPFTSSEKTGLDLVAEKLGNKKVSTEKKDNLPTDESLWDPSEYECGVVSAIDNLYVLARREEWLGVYDDRSLNVEKENIERIVLA